MLTAPSGKSSRPCVFFDRDGIVNESPGPGYVNRLQDFHILPGFIQCLRVLAEKQISAIIVTNQRGVALGITPQSELDAMHQSLMELTRKEQLPLLDIIACTVDDNSHPDRKPNPGMLLTAAKKYSLDMAASWMVGDRESDILTGQRAGVGTTVLVSSPSFPSHPIQPTFHVDTMEDCAQLLQKQLPAVTG